MFNLCRGPASAVELGRHAEAELPLREAVDLMGNALDPELVAVLEELYAAHRRWPELCDSYNFV